MLGHTDVSDVSLRAAHEAEEQRWGTKVSRDGGQMSGRVDK